jgi:hypothetical protein
MWQLQWFWPMPRKPTTPTFNAIARSCSARTFARRWEGSSCGTAANDGERQHNDRGTAAERRHNDSGTTANGGGTAANGGERQHNDSERWRTAAERRLDGG